MTWPTRTVRNGCTYRTVRMCMASDADVSIVRYEPPMMVTAALKGLRKSVGMNSRLMAMTAPGKQTTICMPSLNSGSRQSPNGLLWSNTPGLVVCYFLLKTLSVAL